jgi:hypothetical protein
MHLLSTVEHGSPTPSPRPCEHFDIICGMGTGGLVAILFGMLGMRCDEAMKEYVRLGQLAFEEKQRNGRPLVSVRTSSRLDFAEELSLLVEARLGNRDARMKNSGEPSECRVSAEQPLLRGGSLMSMVYSDVCRSSFSKRPIDRALPHSLLQHAAGLGLVGAPRL